MNGLIWVGLGMVLFAVNVFPPYQRWALQRLRQKGFAKPEQKMEQRKKVIHMLAAVYILAGFAIWYSEL